MMHRVFRRLAGAWADRALVRRVSDLEMECADLRAKIADADRLLGESITREARGRQEAAAFYRAHRIDVESSW